MAMDVEHHPDGYPAPSRTSNGRPFTIAAFVCAAVALIFLPIVLGPLAIIFGLIGNSKGDPLGKWAAVAGGVALVAGFAIGYAVLHAAKHSSTR